MKKNIKSFWKEVEAFYTEEKSHHCRIILVSAQPKNAEGERSISKARRTVLVGQYIYV